MKNRSDQENYNREFQDLQMQMFDLANLTFNGVSLFATTKMGGGSATFDNLNQDATERNAVFRVCQCRWQCRPSLTESVCLIKPVTIGTAGNDY